MEDLLAAELVGQGAEEVQHTRAGVYFDGPLAVGYRACLWSRVASRVVMSLGAFPARTADQLYAGVRSLPWCDLVAPKATIAVSAAVDARSEFTNTLFVAQKTKDAVVDAVRAAGRPRPSVDVRRPDLRIHARIRAGEVQVALDLSGDSLHRRGYRVAGGEAPLKENLAAAVLMRAGWPAMASSGAPLIDPMCGSGTLPIEAALMAGNIAPGLLGHRFGFEGWAGHDRRLWQGLCAEARELHEWPSRGPIAIGFDAQARAVEDARRNLEAGGLSHRVHVERRTLENLVPPRGPRSCAGLLVVNPPYGHRLGDKAGARELYELLGRVLRARFSGWRAAVLTLDKGLGFAVGLRAAKVHRLYNGALKVFLLSFEVP